MNASFRDPAGQVFKIDGRILRLINRSGIPDFEAFFANPASHKFVADGHLISAEIISPPAAESLLARHISQIPFDPAGDSIIIEHERIAFQSFPYEWPPEMLYAAGELTLNLAEALLAEGFGLKDATPYNLLFRGPQPVFVDWLSFERRQPGDAIWLPYAQFVRTFLLPLLVNKYFGIPLDQLLTTRRDGLEPEEVFRLCSPIKKLMPPFLSLVSLPTWLASSKKEEAGTIYQRKLLNNPEKARFILESLCKRLRRTLNRLHPEAERNSRWSDYMGCNNYTDEHFRAKQQFVEQALNDYNPGMVLDVGCNTGHFSVLAAKPGRRLVAIDYDPQVVGETWRKAQADNLDILPLVINLTRPSPATGWRNQECAAFLERATGAFDAVMMLAVVHHMLVSERIPLNEIIDLAAELTTDLLIIEFIAPEDSMFRRISRGRDHLFAGLTTEVFEQTCLAKFEIIRSQHLENTNRWIYLLRKR